MDHRAVDGAMKLLLVEAYVVPDKRLAFFTLHVDRRGKVHRAEWFSSVSSLSTRQGSVADGGIVIPELQGAIGKVGKAVAKINMRNCMKNKWIKKDGEEKSGNQNRHCPR